MKKSKITAFAAASVLAFSALALPSANAAVTDIQSYTTIFGDANNDGIVSGNDVLSMMRYFLYRSSETETVEISLTNINLDRNGVIELTELATLKQYTMGDTVSMSYRTFNAGTEKSDDNMLLKWTDRYVATVENVTEDSMYCASTYDDACTYLKEMNLEKYRDYLDNTNIPGSPCYDGVKNYDVVFIYLLNDTALRLNYDTDSDSFEEIMRLCTTNGEIWATPCGFDLRVLDEAGNDAMVMFTVNIQALYEAANKYNYDLSDINKIGCTRNGKHFSSLVYEDKPVIYLYPEEETEVNVKLDLDGELMHTYPKYPENGWDVTAKPDGTLTDKDGYEYSYLFWEGVANKAWDMSEGFVVKGEDTVSFLREKLSYMGLTPKEYNEFIVYWLPLMENNRYNLISFQQENYTEAAKLTITPQPDSMQRVFMAFKALDEYIDVPEQELPTFERKGFSVVEWGGAEVK